MSSAGAVVAAAVLLLAGCARDGLLVAEVDEAASASGAIEVDEAASADAAIEVDEAASADGAIEVDEAASADAAIEVDEAASADAAIEVNEATGAATAVLPGSRLVTDADIGGGESASEPSKSEPAAYTKFVVEQAVALYDAEGLAAALAHYNNPDSVDGQWYVFIIDKSDTVIGHYDPERRGLDVKGWVGTDINGYHFGSTMLAADEAGRWVPYVYVNPAEGTLGDDAFELKNAWVMRHDGLLFGSGWYINTEEFVPQLISESAEHFRAGGLEAILEFYNDPQGLSTGLIPTVEYYNSTDTLDGTFSGFIASPDGEILTHIDPGLIGTDIEDLLGPAVRNATAEGAWITAEDNPVEAQGSETMRMWVIEVDGTLIGGGWYQPK